MLDPGKIEVHWFVGDAQKAHSQQRFVEHIEIGEFSMGLPPKALQDMLDKGRSIETAESGDMVLGPLKALPGVWKNTPELRGFGFNMIALPFATDPLKNGYRILMNQYDEELHFSIVDKAVPNRGIRRNPDGNLIVTDQTIVGLDYDQKIVQISADDFPASGLTKHFDGKPIHKEQGLWLHMTDFQGNIDGTTLPMNIARLGTIPHGNSFLAVGHAPLDPTPAPDDLKPEDIIPNVNGVVVGGGTDPAIVGLTPDYFKPYKHFHENPFKGIVTIPGFNGFEPVDMTALLRHALEKKMPGKVKKITRLHIDSTRDHAGVKTSNHAGVINVPFVVRQADANAVNMTLMVYEVEDAKTGKTRYFMQYVQNIILDFIGRPDGHPGNARWPHVSINTMERVADADPQTVKMRMLSR